MSNRENMEKILENTRKQLATGAASTTQLNSVLLPVIRRVMPKLIAEDICGVQPMTGPFVDGHAKSWNPDTFEVVFGWLWGDWKDKIVQWCCDEGLPFQTRDGEAKRYTMKTNTGTVKADTIFVFNDAAAALLCYLRFS